MSKIFSEAVSDTTLQLSAAPKKIAFMDKGIESADQKWKENHVDVYISKRRRQAYLYILERESLLPPNLIRAFSITDPPENIEISQDVITVEEGISPEKILCTAEAYPQANYYWKYNDEIVATDNLLFFDQGISREEAGEYTCIAQNRHGSSQILTRFDVLCKYSMDTSIDRWI